MSDSKFSSENKSSKKMKKPRRGKLNEASDVLEQVLLNNKSPLSDQFLRWKLWRKWDEVVGPTISAQTMPVGFLNGILYIWVKNSVWMNEMIFLAGPIKEKVNKFADKNWARQVRFTLNQHEVPKPEEDSEIKDSHLLK